MLVAVRVIFLPENLLFVFNRILKLPSRLLVMLRIVTGIRLEIRMLFRLRSLLASLLMIRSIVASMLRDIVLRLRKDMTLIVLV